MIYILIDNGHGYDTLGKYSPDKKYYEYKWAREMAQMIVDELTKRGYDARRIVPEETDIPLNGNRPDTRVKRVNSFCKQHGGAKNVLLVSIHSNANSGDGQWHDGKWSGFVAEVSQNASDNSKRLADFIWKRAIEKGLKGNRSFTDADGKRFLVQNLAICRETVCPATLTESEFHDTHEGVAILTGAETKKKIMLAHVEGIIDYINYIEAYD